MIKIYTKPTPCGRCNIARSELIRRGIEFSEHTDIMPIRERITAAGITDYPIIDTGDKLVGGLDAIDWIRQHGVK